MSVLNDCFKHIIINSAFLSGKYNKAKYRECFLLEAKSNINQELQHTFWKMQGTKEG